MKQGDYFTFSIFHRIEWQYDNMNPKTLNDPKRNPKVSPKKMKRYAKL